MNKLVVLNHKMNLLYDDIYEYIQELNKINTSNNLIVCPSDIYLETFISTSDWRVGSQNVYHELKGNFTGELSTLQLRSMGVEYSLVGHPDRKKFFKESSSEINLKLKACLDGNVIPILFFGEEKPEDIYGQIDKQIETYLKGIRYINFINFVYEPMWYDELELQEDTEKVFDYIFNKLKTKYKQDPTILYGGRIEADNLNDILNIPHINGIVMENTEDIEKIEKLIEKIN